MDLLKTLEILADAAEYGASRASSGTEARDSPGRTGGIGPTEGMGICHAYAPDGRCISPPKGLPTDSCIHELPRRDGAGGVGGPRGARGRGRGHTRAAGAVPAAPAAGQPG